MIGRWTTHDPASESMPGFSPYSYTFNNPLKYTDPDGQVPDITILGENSSSVTLKTDLIDVSVNAASLGVDFGGNYTLEGEAVLGAGLDIVGVFDPTGIADGLNAGLQAKSGDWFGAGISAIGIVPYIGDLAKVGKIGKDVKIIDKAIDALKTGDKVADSEKTYQTYTKTNKITGEVYSGRTSGKGTPLENIAKRDKNHHMNDKGFGPAKLDKSSTNKDAIRGREQQLINKNGGAKSQNGTSGNSINSVSSKNPKRKHYEDEANKL